MARRRVAIIGLGMVVDMHARSLQDLSARVEVAYAYSPTDQRRQAFAARYPFTLTDRLETIFEDASVDAVIVLSPAGSHGDIVKRAAAAGKHVLLEKPIEITTARAEEAVLACEQAGLTLGIVFQHRFRPAGQAARRIVESGALGGLVGCSTTARIWRPQSYYDEPGRGTFARDGGGVLISQAIHTLDLMLSLAGPIVDVRGYVATTPVHRMETEDMVTAAVRYANGAIGVVDATTAAYPGFPERIEMIFEHGTLALIGSGLEVAFHDGRRETVAPYAAPGGTGADPMAFPHDWHRSVIEDFLDALDEGRPPRVTGRDGLRVHRLIDALVKAGKTDGPVALEMPTADAAR